MGFIVTQPVEDRSGNFLDQFYVRIESYQINKVLGILGTSISHYDSPESAKTFFPDFKEDVSTGGIQLNVSMSYNGEWREWPMWYSFPLERKVEVVETVYSSSWAPETIEYIDFDDNGNEVTKTKEEWFETITSSSMPIEKTLKDISIVGEDVYGYAYKELKEVYANIFGEENIIDE